MCVLRVHPYSNTSKLGKDTLCSALKDTDQLSHITSHLEIKEKRLFSGGVRDGARGLHTTRWSIAQTCSGVLAHRYEFCCVSDCRGVM